ncbi:MAG: hypothetical protein Q9160_000690 [Pyrenula sp. 1 TL-2023]
MQNENDSIRSKEMQQQARRVHEENTVLRSVIRDLGLSDDALQQRLGLAMSANGSACVCHPQNGASMPLRPAIIPIPPAANANGNLATSSVSPSNLDQRMTPPPPPASSIPSTATDAVTYPANCMATDDFQSWDLSSWLDSLSNIHHSYGVEAQTESQFDYGDATSPLNALFSLHEGAKTPHGPLSQRGADDTPCIRDDSRFVASNGTPFVESNVANLASAGEVDNMASRASGRINDNNIPTFHHSSYLGHRDW